MSKSAIKESVPFTFCPKCGTTLADGSCAKCGWALPSTAPYSPAPRRRRRLEFLIAALGLVVLASVGLNLALNFGSTVSWFPADVLLWMDDGKGDASADLTRRLRDGSLSDRQLAKLVTRRLSDPQLIFRSPFPVDLEQVVQVEHNCRMPLEGLTLKVQDWRLLVDGTEVSSSKEVPDSNAGSTTKPVVKKKSRRAEGQVAQLIRLHPLEAGTHQLQLTGDLTVFRNKEPREIVYSRPISVSRDVEINGELADYAKPRTDKQLLEMMRNASMACAWWSGKEDDEYRNHTLSLYAASPNVPVMSSVWVRVGSSGDFTRVGVFTDGGSSSLIWWSDKFSLAAVPGITDARRIQVRLMPDLVAALKNGHDEFFGGIIEWDSVPVQHLAIGRCPDPTSGGFRPPSRVRKFTGKKKESLPSESDEKI